MVFGVLRRVVLTAACWITVIVIAGAWLVIRRADDLTIPTLISYGPRWVWLLPVLLLLPAAAFSRSRALLLAAALAIAVGPILQFELPAVANWRRADTSQAMTVVTLNGGMKLTSATLQDLVLSTGADVLSLQEWRSRDALPRVEGFTSICEGGLCLLSRYPIRADGSLDRRQIGGYFLMALRARVRMPLGEMTVANVHLETVRDGVEAVLARNLNAWGALAANIRFRELESRVVSSWISGGLGPTIIAGDFNLPTDSAIYRAHWRRWRNAFEEAGWGFGWTKRTRLWGIRIDHVLVDDSWTVAHASVGANVGSDHRPVIVRVTQRGR